MDYKISVIVPVYNNEKTLCTVFDTLRAQTISFGQIEAVFTDDCSTDASGQLLAGFAAEHPNVQVLRTAKNTGFPGGPRNIAMDAARGEYLMFLDADDALDPDACRVLYDAIAQSGADIAGGYYRVRDLDDSARGYECAPCYAGMREGLYDFSGGMDAWCPVGDSMWAKIYRKSIVGQNDIRFDDYYAGDDGQFLTEYLCCCKNGVYVHKRIYEYSVHAASYSHSASYRYLSTIPYLYGRLDEITKKHGREAYLHAYYAQFTPLDYYGERMIKELDSIDDDQAAEMLARWQFASRWCADNNIELHSSNARILAKDLAVGDVDMAVFHFRELQRLWQQRQQELNSIFESRTWKLASGLGRLLGSK